jgi:hypothetical protein
MILLTSKGVNFQTFNKKEKMLSVKEINEKFYKYKSKLRLDPFLGMPDDTLIENAAVSFTESLYNLIDNYKQSNPENILELCVSSEVHNRDKLNIEIPEFVPVSKKEYDEWKLYKERKRKYIEYLELKKYFDKEPFNEQ